MRLYLDTSALVKLLIPEVGTNDVRALWAGAGEVFTIRLADVEVRSAITRRLSRRDRERARRRFAEHRAELLMVAVDDSLIEHAGEIAEAHRLRALDALHLAAALAVRDQDLILATWDADLADAARATGLAVAPRQPGS